MPTMCTLQAFGPGIQATDLIVSQITQLAIKILASVTVIWLSFTELINEISSYRKARLREANT